MNDPHTIRASFEKAYEEFLDQIFRFLCSRLSNRERAKELAQETFMRTWKYLVDGNTITNMRPFLYTTAYNLFKNELRAKRDAYSLDSIMEQSNFEPSDGAVPLEDALEMRMLVNSIAELPDSYGEVLRLRYVDGLPVRDIAAMLNENQVTVSVRIHRGINKLRTRYTYEGKTKTA